MRLHTDMYHDWHQLHAQRCEPPMVVDSRKRLRICLAAFVALLVIVLGRAVQLEVTQGAAFRVEAVKPLARQISLPGVRGRLLARDGTILAYDKRILALAVHYRYLQQPPDPRWLRSMARSRLSRKQRKDPRRLAVAEGAVRRERDDLAQRLADLCGLAPDEWRRRAARIQSQVQRIARRVNQRRKAGKTAGESASGSLWERVRGWISETLEDSPDSAPATRVTVAEELDYHVIVEGVPLEVVAEIEGHPERYPGVKILARSRRVYPSGCLAAHVLGHLAPVEPRELEDPKSAYVTDELVGRTGAERQYDRLLRGRRGVAVELTDHSGRILSFNLKREPGVGRDVVLTLDPELQRTAESLLDSALRQRAMRFPDADSAGGAVVVMNVHTGAVLAAASAPRFDPNLFVAGEASRRAVLLSDPGKPLFDRVVRMAIPPGSVFKTLSAVALLETSNIDPDEPFFCQGYLRQPDRQRCALYVRHGVGHGELSLVEALAASCNVYFFHHCGRLGPDPLADWADKFGFGRPTGIDLPGEAAGSVPTPATAADSSGPAWRPGDTQSLAIGQGSLTATPLQVVRMMAAVANGGKLVTPHVVSRLGLRSLADGEMPAAEPNDPIPIPQPQPIADLHAETLAVVRGGLSRVVADPGGTAHGTVYLDTLAIAGKTGTAETGHSRAAHAWFAGYLPAERPKLAFVVVLEHAGEAAVAAGPVARRLALKMDGMGLLKGRPD